ncbi:hypothetical protein Bpfe_006579, partial [Biomphalaria pfeifferi]
MYDTWITNGQHDDNPLSSSSLNGSYRQDNLGGCKKHFRSFILDNWINVKKVKLSVYVNGSDVDYIEFQGVSTSRDTWFKQALISNSSWLNIITDTSIHDFSLQG